MKSALATSLWLLFMRIKESNTREICEHIKIEEGLKVNCNLNTTELPVYLDKNIKELSLSREMNASGTVVANEPLKYSNLITLCISIKSLRVPRNFFSLLDDLKNLTIKDTSFENDAAPELPSSISKLIIEKYSGKPLDLSKLDDLEELTYSSSGLTELPKLPKTPYLRKLVLSHNDLTNLKLLDIAEYCLINFIDLRSTNISGGLSKMYCDFRAWFGSHNISYELSTSGFDFLRNASVSTVCGGTVPQNASSEENKKYEECLSQLNKFPTLWQIVIGVVAIVLIIGLIVIAIIFGVLMQANAVAQKGDQ